ncbi:MAG TPA: CPBP family intramembrane glutamic endopeptidase [Polyangiaceae bacterium LLY-WYZ-14_1]|nr:CPBP family intramembrane glutamic endopeptidase [Polyangiaceae bacterium LLY-WYZ-14_1]
MDGSDVGVWCGVVAWFLLPLSPWSALALFGGLVGFGIAVRTGRVLQLALVGLVVAGSSLVGPPMPWVVWLLPALGLAAAIGRVVTWADNDYWRRGVLRSSDLGLALLFTAVAGAALVGWFSLTSPDLGDLLAMIPSAPLPALVGVAVLFAAANALAEEVLYRGILFDALIHRGRLGVTAAVIVQAVVFGMDHLHGFPRGAVGVGLATVYGSMMGVVRARCGGLLAPWLSHVLVDLVVFAVVAFLV